MDQTTLTARQILSLFRVARVTLNEVLSAASKRPVELDTPDPRFAPKLVNVTLYHRGQFQASMSGRGSTLTGAVRRAVQFAGTDDRHRPLLTLSDLPEVRVELWIYLSSEVLADPRELDLGLEGVELQRDGRFAYYTPSVALTSNVKDQEQLLQKLAQKAGLPAEIWREEGTVIRRTRWVHLVEQAGQKPEFLCLRRLRLLEEQEVTGANIERAARLALDHLLASQDSAGFYLYKHHPFTGRSSSGPTSLIRQAGSAYAVALAAAWQQDEFQAQKLLRSADRAIEFLLSFAEPLLAGGLYIRELSQEAPWGKLGAIGLTLLALQQGPFAQQYEQQRDALATAILAMQETNGAFRCQTDSPAVAQEDAKQDYYPGEALLALCYEARLQSAGEAQRCLQAIERAFPWYRTHFERFPATAFILWQADVWRLHFTRCASATRHEAGDPMIYAEFVFQMVDWLLPFQLNDTMFHADLRGGFAYSGERPGVSTAAYTEAVIRAYGLAVSLGATERIERYRRAALAGLRFLFRLQIAPETGLLFRDPERAVGGITQSLADFTLRCDFDQHAITAFLAALETPGLLD